MSLLNLLRRLGSFFLLLSLCNTRRSPVKSPILYYPPLTVAFADEASLVAIPSPFPPSLSPPPCPSYSARLLKSRHDNKYSLAGQAARLIRQPACCLEQPASAKGGLSLVPAPSPHRLTNDRDLRDILIPNTLYHSFFSFSKPIRLPHPLFKVRLQTTTRSSSLRNPIILSPKPQGITKSCHRKKNKNHTKQTLFYCLLNTPLDRKSNIRQNYDSDNLQLGMVL